MKCGPSGCAIRGGSVSTGRRAISGLVMWDRISTRKSTSCRPRRVPPFNFGWPIMEAIHCFNATECDQTGLWMPTAEIDHPGNCSVTGGYVYRGQAYPALSGVYLFGDYCSGKIWATLPDPDTDGPQAWARRRWHPKHPAQDGARSNFSTPTSRSARSARTKRANSM